MNRIRQRRAGEYPLTATAYDKDGQPAVISGTPTVTIRDGAGAELVSDTAEIVEGKLTYDLPVADLPALDTYSAIWTGEVDGAQEEYLTEFELVGGYLFEIHEWREFDPQSYGSAEKFPAAKLSGARLEAEQRMEHPKAAGVAFVPRGARERLFGDGTPTLPLTWPALRRVVSVSIDGEPIALEDLILRDRCVEYRRGWPRGAVVEIHYEHGYDRPSGPVRKAAMLLAGEYLEAGALSSRAVSESTDVGFFRLSIASPGGRTGIPEVDAVIADERRGLPL